MPVLTAGRVLPGLHRHVLLAGLLALGIGAAGFPARSQAATLPAPAAAQSAPASTPDGAIASFETDLLNVMKAGNTASFVQRFNMLAPAVDRTFDLETILRNSVGFKWATLPEEQRQKLLDTFRRYTIATWVANFSSWSGQQFKVSTELRHVANQVVVPTYLVPKSGSPTNLSFVMKQVGAAWKVVDVLADGSISRVAVQRSDFQGLLSSGGVPALVASLQNKIASLSDGSLA
ncbi:MAG TPA: ABC transporter substrate-binding protein [Acetobacteraceae bacterium]|nr:ABC transporter substrate-binding protein [Acetobacteraceae bacterium]